MRLWWAAARWPTTARQLGLKARVRCFQSHALRGGASLGLQLLRGTTHDDVAAAAERIRSLYGCARVDVIPDTDHGNRVAVALRWLAQPASIEYMSIAPPSRSLVPPRPSTPLPIGLDLDGEPIALSLFHTVLGGTSLLIGGVPGTGKTNALRIVLAGLAQTPAQVVVIDPTGGAEAGLWRPRLSASVVDADAVATAELLHEVLSLIERRGRLLSAGVVTGDFPPVVVVCDELAELGAAGTPKQQDEVRTLLRRVVALGRKANVACVFATQRTTSSSIDVTTRSLVAWRLALAHPGDRYGSEALLGPGRYAAADLSKESRGLGYLTDGGEPHLVQVFSLAAGDILHYLNPGLGLPLSEVARWDEVLSS